MSVAHEIPNQSVIKDVKLEFKNQNFYVIPAQIVLLPDGHCSAPDIVLCGAELFCEVDEITKASLGSAESLQGT